MLRCLRPLISTSTKPASGTCREPSVTTAVDIVRVEDVASAHTYDALRWGLTVPTGWRAWLCCSTAGRDETTEERLERIVRAKVRRDVRQACEWDEMLSGLEGDEREVRLIELARFEHLTPIERSIYCSNGGMAEKEEPPAPVSPPPSASPCADHSAGSSKRPLIRCGGGKCVGGRGGRVWWKRRWRWRRQ